MKNLYVRVLMIAVVLVVVTGSLFQKDVSSNSNGSPAGYAGDPSNGNKNCATTCHSGLPANMVPGLMTSDIPAQGYTPGNTYTITASAIMPGHTEFGFQISPQNASGLLVGSLTLINTTETKLVGSGKYITHTSAGNSGVDSRIWTFNWTAPASGDTIVTFYGAFMASNNDNAKTGDTVVLSNLMINPVGIAEGASGIELSIFPIPVEDKLNLNYTVYNSGEVTVTLYDLLGHTSRVLVSENKSPGNYFGSFDITGKTPAGIYFVKVSQEGIHSVKKVIIK